MKKDLYGEEKKKINKKKIILLVCSFILIIGLIGVTVEYFMNENFQKKVDQHFFMKDFQESETKNIGIENEENSFVCVYNRYIGILSNHNLSIYNALAEKEKDFSINITNPLFEANGKYLAIADKKGKKVYLIKDTNILWQTDVDGEINKITMNKNGYMAVSILQTSNKAAVVVYNTQGKEMFKTHLSNSYIMDTDISNDNKYLGIAEVNMTGTSIQSNVKIVSFEKVEVDADNSIIYNKPSETGRLMIGIKYNSNGELICMYEDGITKIKNQKEEVIENYNNNTLFANIDMNGKMVTIDSNQNEDETSSILRIKNENGTDEKNYSINGIPKELKVGKNKIAVNTGMQAYFINQQGLLIKSYESQQEIKEIILGNHLAAIVYKNKVNILEI